MDAIAEQIAETLAASGVKRIHAVAGDDMNGLAAAVRRQGRIEWIDLPSEDWSALAAGVDSLAECHRCDRLPSVAGFQPGVIVTRVLGPGMTGLELVRHLGAEGVTTATIVLKERSTFRGALEPGRGACAGGEASPSSPAADIYADIYNEVLKTLTPRQRDVLAGLMEGLTNKMIARRLGLSARTVECHRAAIMGRTRARSLSELIRIGALAGR